MKESLNFVYLICLLLICYVFVLLLNKDRGLGEAELAKCVDYSVLKRAQTQEIHNELEAFQHIFDQKVLKFREETLVNSQKERENLKDELSQTAAELRQRAEEQLDRPVPLLFRRNDEARHVSTFEPQNLGEYFDAQEKMKSLPSAGPANEQKTSKLEALDRSAYAGNSKKLNPIQSAWRNRLSKDRKAAPVLERPLGEGLEPPTLLSETEPAETNTQENSSEPDLMLEKVLDIAIQKEQADDNTFLEKHTIPNETPAKAPDEEISEEAPQKENSERADWENIPETASSKIEAEYNHAEGIKILRSFNQMAQKRLQTYDQMIRDYMCILYKWDSRNKLVRQMDIMSIKLREKPYSIYAYMHSPTGNAGRELLFWSGHYQNKVVVYGGPKLPKTLCMNSDSASIRQYSDRSLLQMGFRRLLEELVEISNDESKFENAVIRSYENATVGDRNCMVLQVTFLKPQAIGEEDFHQIQIYVDKEWMLPIKLIIYDWPKPGEEPEIRESYQYVIKTMNPGFTDADFCHLNPQYGFSSYLPGMQEEVRQLKDHFQFPSKGK